MIRELIWDVLDEYVIILIKLWFQTSPPYPPLLKGEGEIILYNSVVWLPSPHRRGAGGEVQKDLKV